MASPLHRSGDSPNASFADRRGAAHPEWLMPSKIPLTIVCGAPASGKSTLVKEHGSPSDLVIDLDVIRSNLSGLPLHAGDEKWTSQALYVRNDLLGRLCRRSNWRRAWFVVGEPKASWRDWWARKLRPGAIVVLETSEEECLSRIDRAPDRQARAEAMRQAVRTWWREYDRRAGDVIEHGRRRDQ